MDYGLYNSIWIKSQKFLLEILTSISKGLPKNFFFEKKLFLCLLCAPQKIFPAFFWPFFAKIFVKKKFGDYDFFEKNGWNSNWNNFWLRWDMGMVAVAKNISLHHTFELLHFLLRLLRFCCFFCNKRNAIFGIFEKMVLRLLQKKQQKRNRRNKKCNSSKVWCKEIFFATSTIHISHLNQKLFQFEIQPFFSKKSKSTKFFFEKYFDKKWPKKGRQKILGCTQKPQKWFFFKKKNFGRPSDIEVKIPKRIFCDSALLSF